MASETGPFAGLNDAIQELGLLSGSRVTPRPTFLREHLEHFRLQGCCERAALQPCQTWNLSGAESAVHGVCRGVCQGQENHFRSRTLFCVAPTTLMGEFLASQNANLSTPYRRSCPAKLAQLSINSHRQHHMKPYNIPWRREERVRTKSENGDTPEEEPKVPLLLVAPTTPLFRSRSLEDVRSPSTEEDLDDVSQEIQRLHVNE
ncbi:uncharacterized protein LOC132196884 [Neocloeon triangulifer]|uniref:uncharacterized protein LOC132196884 n=1 Tax=Neocloeon triangulifer TaxID=2078957 RepID=UPI00286F7A39|nr:uncharacterized protein LOC132196884 [Neocloeon triangulifer]